MKKVIFLIVILVPIFTWAQTGNFTIKAKVEEGAPQKATLLYNQDGKMMNVSAPVKDGKFEFSGTLKEPTPAKLILQQEGDGSKRSKDFADFYLEAADISVTTKDSIKNMVIKGSRDNSKFSAYLEIAQKAEAGIAAVKKEYNASTEENKNNKDYVARLQGKITKLEQERDEAQQKFVKENPKTFISLMALSELFDRDVDFSKLDQLYAKIDSKLRDTPTGQRLAESFKKARLTAVGSAAPDFTQNDVDDHPVSLKDFRGKYVLLDFWASWCGPCRGENPNVVNVFNRYKDKNFTVLGVSLDQPGKKDAWLAAIKADGLAWTQVSDLKFWNNEVALKYGIKGIPQNYLIDPNGKIIAKNLRGDELRKKLAELFK